MIDRVPGRGVTAPVTLASGRHGLLLDQAAMVGNVTIASSLKGAMVSSVI